MLIESIVLGAAAVLVAAGWAVKTDKSWLWSKTGRAGDFTIEMMWNSPDFRNIGMSVGTNFRSNLSAHIDLWSFSFRVEWVR